MLVHRTRGGVLGTGIHPTADKIKAIQDALQPQNVTDLKSFLALLSLYSTFLPISTTLVPLYVLLQEQEVEMGKRTTSS